MAELVACESRTVLARKNVLRSWYHRIALGFSAVALICGCQVIRQIDRNTATIAQNRVAIEKSTKAIINNASAIEESTDRIKKNRNAVEYASNAIGVNVDAIESSTFGIEENSSAAAGSTRAIDANRMAVDRNAQGVADNERIVRESTASIIANTKALEQIDVVVGRVAAYKPWIISATIATVVLLVLPHILMWVTLARMQRLIYALKPR